MTGDIAETYIWRVIYDDEIVIYEEDTASFAEVDQAHVKTIWLLRLQGGASHRVDIPKGAQPVFFRRRSIEIHPLAGESSPRPTVHCIGWKRGDEAVYLFVFDDGSTLLTDNLQAV